MDFLFLTTVQTTFVSTTCHRLDHLYIAVTFYEETWRSCGEK